MKYNININQKLCVEQGISYKAAALLDLFSELSSWANAETFADGVYYQLAYNKILTDLPLVFKKKDTVYRFLKELKEKELVDQCKKGKNLQNFIRLSAKGKSLLRFGNKSEASQGSEIYPTTLGNLSEAKNSVQSIAITKDVNQGSEIYPTYNNNIITYNNLYIDFSAISFLINNDKSVFEVWEMQNKKHISNYLDFLKYFEIKVEEEEIEFTVKKLMGRLKRLAFNWNSNKNQKSSSYEGKLDEELNWFISIFNKISSGKYKADPEYKPMLERLIKMGFKSDEMKTAIRNLYSSSPENSFHIKSKFKFATPEYLLKDDNMNKYLNFKI